MTKEEFQNILNELNINIADEKYNLLTKYCDFLIEYNKHTNLTAIVDEKEIFLKHFYDSLTITKIIDLTKANTLLDIGTGAGFPGVVLAIFFKNLNVVLLDSNNKKITFLKELVNKLNLKNITIVNKRAEDYAKEKLNYFDVVTSRAVANLRVLTEISIPLVKENGYFIAMKGNAKDEVVAASSTIQKLNLTQENIINFMLPYENSERTLLKYKKNNLSNIKKLRNYNEILKKSL